MLQTLRAAMDARLFWYATLYIASQSRTKLVHSLLW